MVTDSHFLVLHRQNRIAVGKMRGDFIVEDHREPLLDSSGWRDQEQIK